MNRSLRLLLQITWGEPCRAVYTYPKMFWVFDIGHPYLFSMFEVSVIYVSGSHLVYIDNVNDTSVRL
jgi:hypothetical protein